MLGLQEFCDVLRECDLNWFYFMRELNEIVDITSKDLDKLLDFSKQLAFLEFSEQETHIIKQSRQAFMSTNYQYDQDQTD